MKRVVTAESLALASWYDSHPAIRRMWAVREVRGLRVIVALEPTIDSSDVYPTWLASRHVWAAELRSHTGSHVDLELIDEPQIDEIETDAGLIATLRWRDQSLPFEFEGDQT